MGQTLACCGKSEVEQNEIKTNYFNQDHMTQSPFFTSLKPADKLAIIIKI